jgi:hypothetical protein
MGAKNPSRASGENPAEGHRVFSSINGMVSVNAKN